MIAVASAGILVACIGCVMTDVEVHNTNEGGERPSNPRAELAAGPPMLVLPRRGDADPVTGELLVVDWEELTPELNMRPSDRFVWPDAENRFGHSVWEVTSAVQPYWINVNLYAAVDSETGMPVDPQTGQPTELPVYEFECQGVDGDRRCPEVQNGVISFDALPASPLPDEYVTVFVAWTVPFTQEELEADPSVTGRRVFASWMFHFVNE